ncbi:MAG TPA: tyrosine--tRNA ligase, partial [Bacteroidota bacterium]|nr:tyrosine--tRNA ligase [Bacteroidota bacterium]
GADLIRRLRGTEVHAIVFPLITTSSGVKFGKTESGTVWLDPSRTSPYRFYQFWYNVEDNDVVKFLKFFTLMSEKEIEILSSSVSPEKREAQKKLAEEVTRLVHGESAVAQAQKASKIFFGGEISGVSETELLDVFSDVPSVEIAKGQLSEPGISILDLMVTADVVKSKGEARRAVQGGGIYLNNQRIAEDSKIITLGDAIHGKFIVLRKGGKNYFLVKIR